MNQKTLEYRKKIADSFVKCLEEKELHWKKNWQGMNMLPESALSGKPYKGCNRLYLSIICEEKGYTDPRFATFRQIVDEGWKLQKGSRGYQVEYWMPYDIKEKKAISWDDYSKMQNEPEQKVGLISRYYTVFNAADIEGIPERKLPEKRDIAVDELIPKISRNMGVEILNDGGDRAFYRPSEDKIHMPKPEYFNDDYSYNSVALHELSHATGAENRLNRAIRNYFGSESYAYEELIAEISSAFMSQNLSVAVNDYQMDNHKAYIQGWIKGIREKPDSLIMAIREAEKAANYLEYHAELINETEYKKTLGETKEFPAGQATNAPAKMTLQEYLDSKGVGSPVGPYQDDKLIGHMKVVRQESTKKDWERTTEEYWKKREQARQEYKEKVESGELKDKTTIERALDSAQGHEDLESTQAARRLLAKRGIDWKTGEKIVMEKGGMQMEGMEQKITMPANEEPKEIIKENNNESKNQVNQRPKSEYKAYGNFVKVDTQTAEEAGTKEPKVAYGSSKEEILEQYQKFNNERMQENDSIRIFDTCSIGHLNPETGKYENYIRYDVVTGEEIPNIYLKFPYAKDQELFAQMRAELKENGARFDPEKKQWYVGADADLSKFEKYLPKEGEEAKEVSNNQQASNAAANPEAAKIYLKLPYTKDQELFAQMRAELKENGARFDPEKKQWYVSEDADLTKFEKYLPKEGEEIKGESNNQQAANPEAAKIYLKLPYTKDQELFAQMRAELKENGARFDPEKKQWYVSEDADLTKFEKYFPKEGEEIKEEPNNQQAANAAADPEAAKIYLKLPYTKDQELFAQMRAELKENGARFDPEKKQWYINEDADLSKFEKYLPKGEQAQQIPAEESEAITIITKEDLKEIGKDIGNTHYWPEDIPYYSLSAIKYEVNFDDGKKIDIDVKDIKNFYEMTAGEQLDVIDEKIREHLAKERIEKESSSQEMPAEIPENKLEETALKNQETTSRSYTAGEQVKLYVPEYAYAEDKSVNRTAIKEIDGTIQDVLNNSDSQITYIIKQEDGQEAHINSDQIYTNSQAEALKRVMEDRLPPEKFELVSSMRFSAAQMEELRFGFKDGLDEDQVFNYAKPEMEAGDMNLYRYGQIHGLKPEQIERIIQTEQPEKTAWADKRREIDKEIHSNRCRMAKTINQQGFKANPQLVKNIETLNHLTKKENSLKDISQAYKNQTLKERPECQELVDKIGNELKIQELAKNVPCQ